MSSSAAADPEPASPHFGRRLWLPAGVLVGGLLVLGLLLSVRWLHLYTQARDAAWIEAIGTVESDVAISHLWMEELVSGDQVDAEEIDSRLERASRLVDGLLGLRPASIGQLELLPLRDSDDPAARQELQRLAYNLDEFRQIAEDRKLGLQRGLPVGIGSSFDVRYDAVFQRVLGHVSTLRASLEELREATRRRERHGTWVFAASWLALVATASAGLLQFEERRHRATRALAEHRGQLQRVQRTEAVGRLAGGLAHDLGNYLAAIRAQCELLLRKSKGSDTLNSDQAEARMITVLAVLDKASAQLDRLLSFHRGSRIGELETINLNDLLRGLEDMIRSLVGGSIELRITMARDLWPVAVDPSGVEQAIVNLAINARDAMPEGGQLTLCTTNQPKRGPEAIDKVRLIVADHGVGIEPDALARIFDPFWSTKGGSGHSGLGLAIVDTVIHQMGGTISVISRPGAGTAFYLDFPRHTQ